MNERHYIPTPEECAKMGYEAGREAARKIANAHLLPKPPACAPQKPQTPVPKLLPCPFCGGDGRVESCEYGSSDYALEYYVMCASCGASGPATKSRGGVHIGWNLRTETKS